MEISLFLALWVAGTVIWLLHYGIKNHETVIIVLAAIALAIFVIPLFFGILFVGCALLL